MTAPKAFRLKSLDPLESELQATIIDYLLAEEIIHETSLSRTVQSGLHRRVSELPETGDQAPLCDARRSRDRNVALH